MTPDFLKDSYKQYKDDTDRFATWLLIAAKKSGYELANLSCNQGPGNINTKGKAKGESKGKAKAAPRADGESKSRGWPPRPMAFILSACIAQAFEIDGQQTSIRISLLNTV